MNRFSVGLAVGLVIGVLGSWLVMRPPHDEPLARLHGDGETSVEGRGEAVTPTVSPDEPSDALAGEGPRGVAVGFEETTSGANAMELADPLGAEVAAKSEAPTRDEPPQPKAPWFNDAGLIAQGISEREVERIRLRWEQYVMDQLRAKVAVEGKGRAAALEKRRALMALAEEVLEDLGDDSYDAMLYASGANNRVVISDVLSTSPAAQAGVQTGDEILSLGGQRIFGPAMVQHLVNAEPQGEVLRLEVLRGGELYVLYVERGPLGVKLAPEKKRPYFE